MLEPTAQISLFRTQRIPFRRQIAFSAPGESAKTFQDRTEARGKLKVARGQVARSPEKRLDLPQSHETKGRPRPRSLEGGGHNANWASRIQELCPGSNGNSKKIKGPGGAGCPFQFFSAPPREPSEEFTFMAGPRDRQPERLVCQTFNMFLQSFSSVPKR